jgi:3-phosphoshikimate 1-carboxyvinyltransferase
MDVNGVGVGGFGEPEDVIDCGNSGTGVRLIMGAMATTPISATFTGDASLRGRPMARVTDPLALFGTQKTVGRDGRPFAHDAGRSRPTHCRCATRCLSLRRR